VEREEKVDRDGDVLVPGRLDGPEQLVIAEKLDEIDEARVLVLRQVDLEARAEPLVAREPPIRLDELFDLTSKRAPGGSQTREFS
jgi:hypothetical protein